MSLVDDFLNIFKKRNQGLTRLITINVLIFLFINIVHNEELLFKAFVFPSYLPLFAKHPWTIVTYMFSHKSLGHLVGNMLWLYFLGKLFIEYLGSERLVSLYILGGIAGALLFMLFFNVLFDLDIEGTPVLIGASAGVMAVVVGVAAYLPNYMVHLFFPPVSLQLKYLALISFILTSVLDFYENTGGKVAHIGGAIVGLAFGLLLKNGTDISMPLTKLFRAISGVFRLGSKKKMVVVNTRGRKMSDEEYNMNKKEIERRTNEILDKINRSGYDSLSKEERDFLVNLSNSKK